MTKTIASATDSRKRYFLTINEQGQATDCSCPDRQYRHHECKHMRNFNQEVRKAETFLSLKASIEAKERELSETRRCYFEMSLGY